MEIWQLQERLKKSHGEAIIQKEVMQKQEVSALTQEWNKERQVGVSLKLFKSLDKFTVKPAHAVTCIKTVTCIKRLLVSCPVIQISYGLNLF